ncbi:MAG: DUF3224 domain-containing protein [Actinomycetota bacterium]|nr:DUF3224 domain-containing protein [Actinomycetota bacterium]
MTTHATITVEIRSWDEAPYFEDEDGSGAKLTRATVAQGFAGDLEGEGTMEFLMAYRPDGSAGFIGQQRIEGALAGRPGAFIIHATGAYEGSEARSTFTVVDGSGTGGLAGLRGGGTAVAGQDMSVAMAFDYDLG